MSLGNDAVAIRRINECNTLFWLTQSELTLKLISDPMIFRLATNRMTSGAHRGIPVKFRKSLEEELAGAEDDKRILQADFSRKGGKARKSDALQDLIMEIVSGRPTITGGQLLWMLERDAGAGVVTAIERRSDIRAGARGTIYFVNDDERPKTASVSGLKYRLLRAKAKLRLH